MSEDPIGFAAGDANLGRYVGNEPTKYVDPSGLTWYKPWTWGPVTWFADFFAHDIHSRTAEIERNIRSQQQEHALANPQCADPEALRPYASDAEIKLMTQYAEAGIQYNAMVLGGGALRPTATQWGWTGSNSWRAAVKEVGAGGTGGVIRTIGGKVPTYEEAVRLICESGGKVVRVEGPHAAGGVAGHLDFPHINYTTASGGKGHLAIQTLPEAK
jgi:hypothetical protein